MYECKNFSFERDTNNDLIAWKSTGIDNYSTNSNLKAIADTANFYSRSENEYEGYGICFDEGGSFTSGNITNGRNVLVFGVDMSFSTHSTNKTNNIYVLGKDFVQRINVTTFYAEKIYKTSFTEPNKKFVLSLHYNFSNSYLFVKGVQQLKFKTKASQILKNELCIGNLSSDWTTANSEKTGLYGKVYDFAVDYHAINGVKAIYDIHRYLMTKHNI